VNFTREPIIETIITPKEGYKLSLRNSKGVEHEEILIDALEVISFGNICFYRSLDRQRAFLLPASDYEIVEQRESRVSLKTPGIEKGIKIGGGREAPKAAKEPKEEESVDSAEDVDGRGGDKRRDKKRFRKRRGDKSEGEESPQKSTEEKPEEAPFIKPSKEERATIIPPPSTLISETLSRYKDSPGFASAFYKKEEEPPAEASSEELTKEPLIIEDEEPELNFFLEEKRELEESSQEEEF